jgi:hypothetical protein
MLLRGGIAASVMLELQSGCQRADEWLNAGARRT